MPRLVCVARGSDAVDNGFARLDDTRVQFMLVKLPVGQGTFKRNKWVYVHHVGPQCSIVKRGKWNAEKSRALEAFQTTAAGIESSNGKAALSFATLVEQLRHVFVTDDGTFSIKALQEEYTRRLAEEKAQMVVDAVGTAPSEDPEPASPLKTRKLATELGVAPEPVLKAIQDEYGPFNWCVFAADPKRKQLVEAGSNGLFELCSFLEDAPDKVYCGLIRVAFGTGRFRRSKRIFFQWNGDDAGAVAKGRANASKQDMVGCIGPAAVEVALNGSADATVDGVINKVAHVFVVDNIAGPSSKPKKAVSAEEYVAALQEEQHATREFYQEPDPTQPTAPAEPGPAEFDLTETVGLIRREEGGLTWCVVSIE